MSPNPYPLFSVSQDDNPELLKEKTRILIRLYLKDPNAHIAGAVAKHMTAILAHPEFSAATEHRCLFRHLEMHWRCLAWIDSLKQT